ncbi:MAG: PQQ-dependent sugar dehydrogenase, partial [Vicinamibacteria bacterium]
MFRESRSRIAPIAALLSAFAVSPAFSQNRILTTTVVASGFHLPVQVTHAGDGSNRRFVVEQEGVVRIIDNGAVLPTPFLDLTAIVANSGERGLLGLAFHPSYAQNGFFYVNYTDLSGNTVIARYSVSGDADVANPASASILLQVVQPFANHNGGMMQFGPLDGYLYIALGDGGSGNDPFGHGQNKNTLLGSILRIDVDGGSPYAIPAGNPYLGVDGADEIWAIGLRNPWRFSFDRETGDLLIGDVGQSRWEEIDFQPAGTDGGLNFGWAHREGPCPRGSTLPCPPAPAAFTDPVAFYGRSAGAAVTGGFVYRGTQFPSLIGRYFFADFISGRMWSLSKTGPKTWSPLELEAETGFNVSSFGEDEQGNLYVADYSGGTIRLLEDSGAPRSGTTLVSVDGPLSGAALPQNFTVAGWAIDPSASSGGGIDDVEIWAFPEGGGFVFLGAATYGIARPDVGTF